MKRNDNRGFMIIIDIIIVIIALYLCFLALGYFSDQHPFGLPNFKQSLNLACGLTVQAPKENATVSFPYTMSGYANGCDWLPNAGGVIGTISVLAPNGLSLASGIFKADDLSGGAPYYFDISVNVPVTFFGEQGAIVFDNGLPGLEHKTIQIPVKFGT